MRKEIWRREVRARLASLRLAPEREAEIVDELSAHLEDRWRELVAGGATEEEATRIALAGFRSEHALAADMSSLRQAHASPRPTPGATSGRLLTDLWRDVAYAARTFARQPGFTFAAMLTLALGIGANSAIFSVVHAVLLESLPFRDADRLYRLRMVYRDGNATTTLSAPDYMTVREQSRVFDRVEAYTSGQVTLTGAGEPRDVRVVSVTEGLFDMLGLGMALGRGFVTEDMRERGVAVLDHGFWLRAFGGDPGVIGRRITIGGAGYHVAGVLSPGARLPADVTGARMPSDADVYMPIFYTKAFNATSVERRTMRYLAVLGRAKPDVGAAAVDEDLGRLARDIRTAFPDTGDAVGMNAIAARELMIGDVRTPLLMLLGAVGFVLLVACANVASLMLARASAREEELTVRAALGAGRGRLLRQLLTEAGLLGLTGGAVGLALAYAATRALVAAQPADIPRLEEIAVDRTVALFTFAIALIASLAFGTLPAVQVTGQLAPALRTGGRGGTAGRRSQRLRSTLVVVEIALAVVLLTGAGLLMRTLVSLGNVEPGFTPEGTIAFRLALYGRDYSDERVRAGVPELEAALRALPGVTGAAATTVLPLSGPGPRQTFGVAGEVTPPGINPEIGVVSVTPEYFRTIGARLLRGRDFTAADRAEAAAVAIINEAAVRRWFPNGNPVGRRVEMSGVREIVGVVSDVLQGDPKRAVAPQLFLPYDQRQSRAVVVVVRAGVDPATLSASIRATISRLHPELAVSELIPLDQLRVGSVARPRFYAALLSLFAAVALALAVTGIFGVMSYAVAERAHEIGIRLALGACASDVLRMIVRHSLALALAGVTLGLGAALALGPAIRAQLFGVEPVDLPTFAGVLAVLLVSAGLASFFPARRAAGLDPAATLRR